jgi:hypothetical protein
LRPGVAGQQGRLLPIHHSRGGISSPEYHDTRDETATAEASRTDRPPPASPEFAQTFRDAGDPATLRSARGPSSIRTRNPRRTYAMTRNARIKSVVRGVKYGAQEAEGRAKLTAGKATGNDRLRR